MTSLPVSPSVDGRQPERLLTARGAAFEREPAQYSMSPCCCMTSVPGFEPTHYDGSFDFFEVWNSPAMVELRQRLARGPLLGPSLRCPPVY